MAEKSNREKFFGSWKTATVLSVAFAIMAVNNYLNGNLISAFLEGCSTILMAYLAISSRK